MRHEISATEPPKSKCSLCGSPSEAIWIGVAGEIEICRQCAIDNLPRLIADACWLPAPGSHRVTPNGSARHEWLKAENAFWQAIASRLALMLLKDHEKTAKRT